MIKKAIIIICQLLFMSLIGSVHANVGDIGHWRDSVGGQIPSTTYGGFNFNSEIRNDGIYTKPNDSTIEVTEAGDYLIITTTHDEDTSNGRYNSQLAILQTAGTGDIFSSNYTGFSRDNSENESWTRGVGIVIGATANSQFQVQKRRDTDAPTGGSIVNSSDIQIVKLDKTNYGLYDIGGTGNIYGGTTPNTVDITNISNESNTTSIEGNTTSNTVTIKGDNKTYLIAWSVSFDSGNSRTQRIGHLEYDNNDSLSTRSYCYNRNTANEYCGLGSMDIIRTSTADINLQTEIYRGDGISADQGGANVDGNLATDGYGQMIILEMPDSIEVFNSEDSVGLQDITTAQTLNIARDIEINDTTSFTKASNTTVNVINPSDILSWANVWTARSNISSGARQTSYGSIVIDGVEQTIGRHGSYSRGNQGSQDTFAMGFQPAGIFTTSGVGAVLGVNSTPLSGGEAGGNDRTQPGTLGFFAINLDTLTPPATEPILGVTYNDNDTDNIVKTNQVVKYSIGIQNTGTDATGITALAQINSNFGIPYGFTYLNCGTPSESFTNPNLNFSNISILGGNTCNIEYYAQVDSGVPDASIITSNINVSNATEGGNDPVNINGSNLTVQACGVTNDVNIEFATDNWGYETFWSLTPNGNACGVGEIANGGNTTQVNCTSGGTRVASNGNGYSNNSTINEGPYSLTVGTQYDLHVVDDYGDGMTGAPDVVIQQNGSTSDTFVVNNNGGVFTFTVQSSPACADTINPEVSINQANSQTDPTTLDNITYSVIFNEPINSGTFTSTDVSITGTTGTIFSGPTEIAPFNGTNFQFTINGMTQNDVVTAIIPAGLVEDLVGNTNNISTSSDNQVTYNGVPPSPGGISLNLQLWLKADKGTNTIVNSSPITSWGDQSGNGYDATGGVSPTYINNDNENLNYNPLVDFDGSQFLENLNNGASSSSYFAVIVPDNKVDGTLSGQVPFGFNCNSGNLSSGTCGLAFAGLTLGAFTVAINDEVITHAIGSSNSWRSAQIGTAEYEAGSPMLINMNENSTSNGTEISEKGVILDNYNANTYQILSNADYTIGRSSDPVNTFPYNGKIAEIINYNSRINTSDKEKIESYLSIKYGITLDNGNKNYIGSDGSTIIWSTSNGGIYKNDIFGIGRDDLSELGQVKSKSSNTDNVITIEAIGEGTNINNIFNDLNNLEFLTVANDDGGNFWTSIDSKTGFLNLTRKWKVQELGEVGNIKISFDVGNANFDIPNLSTGTDYYFTYDSDLDGTLIDENPIAMNNSSGNIWEVNSINLNQGMIFSISTEASSNNIPTDISISNNNVNENVGVGTLIGNFSTTDADTSDTHTYSFISGSGDDDNSLFSIIGNSLYIQASPDFEIKNSYSVRIQTDDGNLGQFQKQFSINVINIGEATDSIIDFENAYDENKYTVTSGIWDRNTNNPNEGSYSIESTNSGNNTQSCFEITNTFNATGTITFNYNVSSQANSDYLRFYIDNVQQQQWSGTVPWNNYSKNDITSGTHTYKWCYVKDNNGNGGNDNSYVDYITFDSSVADLTPPTISGTNFADGKLLPGGNHNITINYTDLESGIDINSEDIKLYKWNGSSWGADIAASGFNLGAKTINSTSATYPTSNLSFGKYRFDFDISDMATNTNNISSTFYIDEVELTVSTEELDLGEAVVNSNKFSDSDFIITVKTLGAAFDLILNKGTTLNYSGVQISDWNGTNGFGYDKAPLTSNINLINLNEIIANQPASINTNGLKNTYIYTVKLGINVNEEQAAGEYEGTMKFGIDLDY